MPLFDALRKQGITYESDRALGNPVGIRDLWKNGSLAEGKSRYRRMLRNGRRPRVELLLAHARSNECASFATRTIPRCATAVSSRRKQLALHRIS